MITQLRGRLVEKSPSHIVVDCNGVGYYATISLSTYQKLTDNEGVTVFTHLVVREDAHLLYAFATKAERRVFEHLISVSGVGPSSAIMMLSSLSAQEIYQAIAHEEVSLLQSVKGIGTKTAKRIILDLKNKIEKEGGDVIPQALAMGNPNKEEALSALEVLGITKKTAEPILQKLLEKQPELSVEELIKQTLKKK